MKLLFTADLHHRRDWFAWLLGQAHHYDAVAVAGDLLDMADPLSTQIEFLEGWIGELEKSRVPLLLCCGNHDSNRYPLAPFPESHGNSEACADGFLLRACLAERWMDALAQEHSSCLVSGMTKCFPEFNNLIVTSLFYEPDDETVNEASWRLGRDLRRQLSPPPCWMVLHHEPPLGKLGRLASANPSLATLIEEFQPAILLCGHDHAGPAKNGGCHERIGLTHVFNPGHNPKGDFPNHVVLDTSSMQFTWHR